MMSGAVQRCGGSIARGGAKDAMKGEGQAAGVDAGIAVPCARGAIM